MKRILIFIAVSVISIGSFAQLIKEPYLIYTGNNETMKVMFQAEKPQVYIVSYGQTKEYEIGSAQISQQKKGKNENIFTYTFKFLKSNSKYYYRISDKHKNEIYTGYFNSGKQATDKKVYFSVIGNAFLNEWENDSVSKAFVKFKEKKSKFNSIVLHTGNLVKKGYSEESWNNDFFNKEDFNKRKLHGNIPILSTLGSNEAKKSLFSENKLLFRKYFQYPFASNKDCYYTVKYGNVKFVVLDQFADLDKNSEQFQWLNKELKSDSVFRKIVLMHSFGKHKNAASIFSLNSLFEMNKVKLVFTGNANGYSHIKIGDTHYFSTGGKSFAKSKKYREIETIKLLEENSFITVKYEGDNISIVVFNSNLEIIDKYIIK